MNTISSIKHVEIQMLKRFHCQLSVYQLHCVFIQLYMKQKCTTNKKVGEYVNRTYFPYYGTNMISTEAPSSLTNTNLGSFILSDANNYVAYTGNSITFNSGQNMTICFWFKLTSVTGNGSVKISF